MSDESSAARPYARAAFEWAQSHGALQAWEEAFQFLVHVVSDARVHELLGDPRVDREDKLRLILEVGEGRWSEAVTNFLRVLALNGRLQVLPDIYNAFIALKAETEKRVVAEVVSYQALTKEQENTLLASLGERLGSAVELNCTIDETLLGGIVVRAGDLVIDGSVRGRLTRLATHLSR